MAKDGPKIRTFRTKIRGRFPTTNVYNLFSVVVIKILFHFDCRQYNNLEARCHGQWELRGEAGTAAIIAVVGCSLGRSFYCSASGASVAGLVPGVKQTPGSVSIV